MIVNNKEYSDEEIFDQKIAKRRERKREGQTLTKKIICKDFFF